MQDRRLLPRLLSLFVFAACTQDQPPTAPAEPGGPVYRHTAGHKIVNSLADPGNGPCNAAQCTLREAINDPASTEISVVPGLTGPITLARPGAGGGTLLIEKTLTITGPSTGIVIRRRSTDPAFRIFRIDSGVTVTLTNLTIQGGKPPGPGGAGGGIVNRGTLELTNCTVSGNSAAQGGGGIDNFARLTLRHSTIASNTGTGIFNYTNGTLTLRQSTVAHNSLGIGNSGGDVVLTRSTVSENLGAGIFTRRGRVTLTEARIVANNGSGISAALAFVALTNTTVARNTALRGGGIAAFGGSRITIANSTLVGNSSTTDGGGILTSVGLRAGIGVTLTNSTVSGNSASAGGGIAISSNSDLALATLTLTNSTVAFNSATQGGGIENFGTLILTNSLVARNIAPTGADVFGVGGEFQPVTARFSLIGDGSGSGITNTDGNQVGNVPPNTSPIDPRLGPLANNGGPTRTHALLLGSPAIDAAATPDCPATDQRGVLRPQGAACDIGSYERAVQ
jgi:CSLREA domain-containing protein